MKLELLVSLLSISSLAFSFCKNAPLVRSRVRSKLFSNIEKDSGAGEHQNSLYIEKSKRLEESLDRHEEHNGNLHGIGKKGQVRVNDVMENKENVVKNRATRQIRCFPGMMRCFNSERQKIQGRNQNCGRGGFLKKSFHQTRPQ